MRCLLSLSSLLILTACQTIPETTVRMVPTSWIMNEGLCDPETIIEKPGSDHLIVSNICAFEKNGKGYLSIISRDGEMITEKWVEGLNAPAGMAAHGDYVYVADFDRLTRVNAQTGESEFLTPDIEVGAFNDVASDGQGVIYVSDSAKHRIVNFEITENSWSVLDDHHFQFANGLYYEENILWVGSEQLCKLHLSTNEKTVIENKSIADIDGIETDGKGGLVVSIVGGNVWHLPATGEPFEYTTEKLSSTNHYYDPNTKMVLVPTGFDNSIIAFEMDYSVSSSQK